MFGFKSSYIILIIYSALFELKYPYIIQIIYTEL